MMLLCRKWILKNWWIRADGLKLRLQPLVGRGCRGASLRVPMWVQAALIESVSRFPYLGGVCL